ncbi:hypothetical protein GBA65_07590 [Rubrobacter marinus]|uniref:Cation/H+ exchanger domain-containing protein n=1 Tax=Rubrobacter marinus TaxID=2653852 RepID=A0A6G8PW29_9ACTN|nr:hypothetical protein [Rubrobacter marinus]QIN78410.1 hypothetical protein GBA65_07590 [Rubrobacter marinus]
MSLVMVLLAAVAALATVARRIGVPYPILLVLGSLALASVPGLPRVKQDPEIVVLLFLLPLLFLAAYSRSAPGHTSASYTSWSGRSASGWSGCGTKARSPTRRSIA